jgi:hypothetical protein
MKKMILITLVILALLFSFLPSGVALAGKDPTGELKIRNNTGAPITLILTDAKGNRYTFTFQPGQSSATLPEGQYSYYIRTACGNQAGGLGLNHVRQLLVSCKDSQLGFDVSNPNAWGYLPYYGPSGTLACSSPSQSAECCAAAGGTWKLFLSGSYGCSQPNP